MKMGRDLRLRATNGVGVRPQRCEVRDPGYPAGDRANRDETGIGVNKMRSTHCDCDSLSAFDDFAIGVHEPRRGVLGREKKKEKQSQLERLDGGARRVENTHVELYGLFPGFLVLSFFDFGPSSTGVIVIGRLFLVEYQFSFFGLVRHGSGRG
jgi:hypothetical protein